MCGIVGFLTDKPNEENYTLLGDLLYLASSRGTDATGLAVLEKKKMIVTKAAVPSDVFLKKYYVKLEKAISQSRLVIGHTRAATQGHQSDNNNNHPVIGPKYVMVHNGTCSTMDRIKSYPYKGTVDSEILLSYVEKEGIKKGLGELRGSAAVAFSLIEEPSSVYLWRHSNPLWIAYDPGKQVIFFGSTEEIMREGLSNLLNVFTTFQMRAILEDCLYQMSFNPLNVEVTDKIELKRWYGGTHNQYRHPDWNYYGDSGWGGEEVGDKEKTTPSSIGNSAIKDSYLKTRDTYLEIAGCVWDAANKIYTKDPIKVEPSKNRYYFNGPSLDFEHWSKLQGGGHVSVDKKLLKFFDHQKKSHFLITLTEAIREGLLDFGKGQI